MNRVLYRSLMAVWVAFFYCCLIEAMEGQESTSKKRSASALSEILNPEVAAEQEAVIPPAPPLPKKKSLAFQTMLSRRSEGYKEKAKGVIQPVRSYEGYHTLAMIFSANAEKISNAAVKKLGDKSIVRIEAAMTGELAYMLGQKSSPVLVDQAYLLENILLLKIATEKYALNNLRISKMGLDLAVLRYDINNTFSQMYRTAPVPEDSSFFKRYKERFSGQPNSLPGTEYIYAIPYSFPVNALYKDWLLFEYHNGTQRDRAYLLIPYAHAHQTTDTSTLQRVLSAHGFNPAVFKHKSILELEKELKDASNYSAYTKSGPSKTHNDFSLSVIDVVDKTLTDDPKKPWVLFIVGHGYAHSLELKDNIIAGLNGAHVAIKLLPLLEKKNSRFCYIASCGIGGVNRDFIRQALSPLQETNVLRQAHEGEKDIQSLKYSNNLITVVGGFSDAITSNYNPIVMPINSIANFNKVWSRIDKDDPIGMSFMPFVPSIRYDLFFDAVINHLSAEEVPGFVSKDQRGKSIKAMLISWKDALKYVTPCDIYTGNYEYSNIPQIRFPTYNASFNAIEVDERVKVLSYVDLKARELEAKMAHKSLNDYPIIINNKDVVIVASRSINVPLEINGKVPAIVFTRAGDTKTFFKKIICNTGAPLYDALYAMLSCERNSVFLCEFFIEELHINGTVLYDVMTGFPKGFYYYRTNPQDMTFTEYDVREGVVKTLDDEESHDSKDYFEELREEISKEEVLG